MSKATKPHATESLTCDACGVSRQWGAYNADTQIVICQECIQNRDKGGSDGAYVEPSDHVGTIDQADLACVRDV